MPWTTTEHQMASRAACAVETELQLQLTAQRLQLEQSRTDYCTLKSNFQRLDDEFAAVKDDLKSVVEDRDRTASRYKCLLEQARRDLGVKHVECEEYKMLNPKRVELMRNEIYQEIEKLFHMKLEQMAGDLESVRHDFSRVSHELSLCEAELDQEKKESVRTVEDLKQQHDSELSALQRENEQLRHKQCSESSNVAQQLNRLQTENAQLQMRMTDLMSQQSAGLGVAPDAVTRDQTKKQIADQNTRTKQLQVEKLMMDQESEVDREQLSRLLDEIRELERDRNALKRQMEDSKTQFQLNISNLRLEKMRERDELEKTVEQLQQSLNSANDELKALKTELTAEQEKSRVRSQELQTKLEAEWKNFSCLQNEKIELETKLQAIERKRLEEEEERKRLIETLDERLRNAEQAREEAEHQAAANRTRWESQQRLLDKAQTDYSSTLDLRFQLSQLNAEYQSCLSGQQETVHRLSVELRNAKSELTQSQADWSTDRQKMEKEIQDLREELTKIRRQSIDNLKFYRGRLKIWNILEKKLKQSLEDLRSDVSRLTIEKESGAYQRPAHVLDSEAQTRRQLCDLMEKHRQFSTLLLPSANLSLPEGADQPAESPKLSGRKQD